jgi:hypothetical protein
MRWLGVLDHPYFGVSGADGRVTLKDVPAGDYVIGVWHERFGTREPRCRYSQGERPASVHYYLLRNRAVDELAPGLMRRPLVPDVLGGGG